jgi:hypothetical protein
VDALAIDQGEADCRIDRALFAAVMEANVHGVSTRRFEVTHQQIPIAASTDQPNLQRGTGSGVEPHACSATDDSSCRTTRVVALTGDCQ